MCIGIIRNNSLVDGRARAESNPGHFARHALLHMAAECVNHSATKAGQGQGHKPLQVGNPSIFKSYLLRHLQQQLVTDHWFLN